MEKDFAAIQTDSDGRDTESISFDTRTPFETWFDTLRLEAPDVCAEDETTSDPAADFVIECDSAEDCDIRFDGVLRLNGFLSGKIYSENGILITGPGSLNADIAAGAATIGGAVNGNITVTNRVVLRGRAKVLGNIKSSGVSIKPGTVFRGDCDLHLSASETDSGHLTDNQGRLVDFLGNGSESVTECHEMVAMGGLEFS